MEARPRTLFILGCLILAGAIGLPHLLGMSDTMQGLLFGLAVGCLLGSVLRRWLPEPCDTAPPALRALVALLPVPAIALAMRAIVRHISDTGEMQRRIELEAVSIATALVSLLYMAGGFLQLAKVIDVPSGVAMIWVFPLLCVAYGLIKAVVARRFR